MNKNALGIALHSRKRHVLIMGEVIILGITASHPPNWRGLLQYLVQSRQGLGANSKNLIALIVIKPATPRKLGSCGLHKRVRTVRKCVRHTTHRPMNKNALGIALRSRKCHITPYNAMCRLWAM